MFIAYIVYEVENISHATHTPARANFTKASISSKKYPMKILPKQNALDI